MAAGVTWANSLRLPARGLRVDGRHLRGARGLRGRGAGHARRGAPSAREDHGRAALPGARVRRDHTRPRHGLRRLHEDRRGPRGRGARLPPEQQERRAPRGTEDDRLRGDPRPRLAVPDWFVVPVGNAGNVSAIGKGLREWLSLRILDKKPRHRGHPGRRRGPVLPVVQGRVHGARHARGRRHGGLGDPDRRARLAPEGAARDRLFRRRRRARDRGRAPRRVRAREPARPRDLPELGRRARGRGEAAKRRRHQEERSRRRRRDGARAEVLGDDGRVPPRRRPARQPAAPRAGDARRRSARRGLVRRRSRCPEAGSRARAAAPDEHERRRPDLELRAALELRPADPLVEDVRPVRRAEVHEEHVLVHDLDCGVLARALDVGDDDVGVRAADHDARPVDLEDAARVRARDAGERQAHAVGQPERARRVSRGRRTGTRSVVGAPPRGRPVGPALRAPGRLWPAARSTMLDRAGAPGIGPAWRRLLASVIAVSSSENSSGPRSGPGAQPAGRPAPPTGSGSRRRSCTSCT